MTIVTVSFCILDSGEGIYEGFVNVWEAICRIDED